MNVLEERICKDGVVKEISAKNQDVVEFEQNLFCIGE